MGFFSFTHNMFKALIYREDETPRILRYIYNLIDEDLDNREPAHVKP